MSLNLYVTNAESVGISCPVCCLRFFVFVFFCGSLCITNGHKYIPCDQNALAFRKKKERKQRGIKKESVCIIIHTFIPYKYGYVNWVWSKRQRRNFVFHSAYKDPYKPTLLNTFRIKYIEDVYNNANGQHISLDFPTIRLHCTYARFWLFFLFFSPKRHFSLSFTHDMTLCNVMPGPTENHIPT